MATRKLASLTEFAVPPEDLRRTCSAEELGFASTEEFAPKDTLVGQERAFDAIRFGAGVEHEGYNLFVFGPPATGKHSTVRSMLSRLAAKQPAPGDWAYLNNFEEPDKPVAIELPPGHAAQLKADMDELVEDLSATLPALFESDDYRTRFRAIEEEVERTRERAFDGLQAEAREHEIAILRTPMGFALAPTKNGEVIKPEVFNALPEVTRKAFQEKIAELQTKLESVLEKHPALEKERRGKLRELNAEVASMAVRSSIEELEAKYRIVPGVLTFLRGLEKDLAENVEVFLAADGAAAQQVLPSPHGNNHRDPRFRRYDVNVMVTTAVAEGSAQAAPLVEEQNPSLQSLTGRIEHISQMGALLTDFTLIKPGALHKANGGYLMLDARRVLSEPYAWEALKRCLQSRQIKITSLAEHLSLSSTVSLEPDPIPLSVKVVMIGEPMLYYLLCAYEPEFGELFKVEAEFDSELDWTPKNLKLYAQLIASISKKHGLRPLTADGVSEIISEAARMADDRERLSLAVGHICDLLREADHWSGVAKRSEISSTCVRKAVMERDRRRSLVRERSQEHILRKIALVDTAGSAVGQINGLSVIDFGRFRFGRPARITARTRAGSGKVVDIEREVELGGPLHSKGVLILSSFLASHYALDVPMSLWASLVFEQSYGGIDGDSASSAELYALLSALSGVPIKQQYAVTGSVNQNGEVQAIGGVNEKIEGFFDICRKRRLTGRQGVLIPASNVQHLMLRPDVVEAVKASRFHVYSVNHIDEGIEILTGRSAGKRQRNGKYPEKSVNCLVEETLASYAALRKEFAKPEGVLTGRTS